VPGPRGGVGARTASARRPSWKLDNHATSVGPSSNGARQFAPSTRWAVCPGPASGRKPACGRAATGANQYAAACGRCCRQAAPANALTGQASASKPGRNASFRFGGWNAWSADARVSGSGTVSGRASEQFRVQSPPSPGSLPPKASRAVFPATRGETAELVFDDLWICRCRTMMRAWWVKPAAEGTG
jgi:hypothetical protein